MKKYFLTLILAFFIQQLSAQSDNTFLVGTQWHYFSDWKRSNQFKSGNFHNPIPVIKVAQPYFNFTHTFKNHDLISIELSGSSYERAIDITKLPFADMRTIKNMDLNFGRSLFFFKNSSLSINGSAGLSARMRYEEIVRSYSGWEEVYCDCETVKHTEEGLNVKLSVNKRFGQHFTIGVGAVAHIYNAGPMDVAWGAHLGYRIVDLPKETNQELFQSSFNKMEIGWQHHYFPQWNLPGIYPVSRNLSSGGYRQIYIAYMHAFKSHLLYEGEISFSSYSNSSDNLPADYPYHQFIANLDNNVVYQFCLKKVPTLSFDLSGGVSSRIRNDDYDRYNHFFLYNRNDTITHGDLGCNIKASLNQRFGKHFIIGASCTYRTYIKGTADLAYGGEVGYVFGYNRRKE